MFFTGRGDTPGTHSCGNTLHQVYESLNRGPVIPGKLVIDSPWTTPGIDPGRTRMSGRATIRAGPDPREAYPAASLEEETLELLAAARLYHGPVCIPALGRHSRPQQAIPPPGGPYRN